jgi:DNA-binding MarR family transcriptional regulator
MVSDVADEPAADDQPDLAQPLERLMRAAVGLTTVALSDAAPPDLTLQQWRALVVLGRDGTLRVGDVAARIGISLPSASRLVGRLEEHGYVSTARDERDRRGTIVSLTDHGARVRRAVIERRRFLMLGALGADATSFAPGLGPQLAALAKAFERYS